jgi:hypothetical protein
MGQKCTFRDVSPAELRSVEGGFIPVFEKIVGAVKEGLGNFGRLLATAYVFYSSIYGGEA